eukprot:GHVU01218173.1.p2 GENE.GHVU01218173.1~~GHVU01218173.1.p2  ORF type:complete len:128 (-),score=12.35 GHVU01218173.1:480-863(-)
MSEYTHLNQSYQKRKKDTNNTLSLLLSLHRPIYIDHSSPISQIKRMRSLPWTIQIVTIVTQTKRAKSVLLPFGRRPRSMLPDSLFVLDGGERSVLKEEDSCPAGRLPTPPEVGKENKISEGSIQLAG